MSSSLVFNRVRRQTYMDSVALMRLSQTLSDRPGVTAATLMIGSESNKGIVEEAGLLTDDGRNASANDLIIALRAETREAGESALEEASRLLEQPLLGGNASEEDWSPRTLSTALDALSDANLALISVPGEFAGDEARKALHQGLHVMIFSDNVSVEEECSLKREAKERGLLMMGPDCGTALIGGTPLAFANAVPRGNIGIVSASGTGLQEVSSLVARAGEGISHGIGVGGRDLSDAVGAMTTLMAIDALDEDPATRCIVLISKPPGERIARIVLDRIERSHKPFSVCFVGLETMDGPANAHFASTLKAAAEHVLEREPLDVDIAYGAIASELTARLENGRRWIHGLYSGGTLCAEAQAILRATGREIRSNVPIPGVRAVVNQDTSGHTLLDLGADEYTVGRPHPMIEPSVRNGVLDRSLRSPETGVVLLDVVIGFGAHENPAAEVAGALAEVKGNRPVVIASVCGTEEDPQVYSDQVRILEECGVTVAPSNADATHLALEVLKRLD